LPGSFALVLRGEGSEGYEVPKRLSRWFLTPLPLCRDAFEWSDLTVYGAREIFFHRDFFAFRKGVSADKRPISNACPSCLFRS
jgi:hypothetical protein